jgi:hypothetical protein
MKPKTKTKIRLTQPHRMDGLLKKTGAVISVSDGTARFLVAHKRGTRLEPAPKPVQKPAAKIADILPPQKAETPKTEN